MLTFILISENPQCLPVVSIHKDPPATPIQDAQCSKSAKQSDSVTTSPAQQSGETAVDALGDDDTLGTTFLPGTFFPLCYMLIQGSYLVLK